MRSEEVNFQRPGFSASEHEPRNYSVLGKYLNFKRGWETEKVNNLLIINVSYSCQPCVITDPREDGEVNLTVRAACQNNIQFIIPKFCVTYYHVLNSWIYSSEEIGGTFCGMLENNTANKVKQCLISSSGFIKRVYWCLLSNSIICSPSETTLEVIFKWF